MKRFYLTLVFILAITIGGKADFLISLNNIVKRPLILTSPNLHALPVQPPFALLTQKEIQKKDTAGDNGMTAKTVEGTRFRMKDAYVHSSKDGQTWTIGTDALEVVLECKDGQFRIVSYKNKLVSPYLEYAEIKGSGSLFETEAGQMMERFDFEKLWSVAFAKRETIRTVDKISLNVKKGEIIGFRADKMDQEPSMVKWNISVQYENDIQDEFPGEPALSDGAMYTLSTSGDLEKVEDEKIPGAVIFNLGNNRSLTRVWEAPRDGKIFVAGSLVSGYHGNLNVGIYRIRARSREAVVPSECFWTIETGNAREAVVGGRPAAQMGLKLKSQFLCIYLHTLTFPGTSIIRQWMEIENPGAEPFVLKSPAHLFLNLRCDNDLPWANYWMTGGDPSPNQGVLKKALVGKSYHNFLTGEATQKYVPWTALENPEGDGLFVSSESLSAWNISIVVGDNNMVRLAVSTLAWANYKLSPGERIELPLVTTGVFTGGLDGMGARIYDWQYQYLWDYTNPEYYAQTQYLVPWFFCSRNLQEQFTARLAGLDMEGADHCRTVGIDMLWDDAGWAKYPGLPVPDNYGSVFHHEYEGPDFSQTQHYLKKMNTKWLLWFAGRPSPGVMDAKIASWGDFQWRTDGVGEFNPANEKKFRESIKYFLDRHPRSSFHTCDGGSRYAHTFEIQRYADLNYLSDIGRGDETNYYFSYLDTPDKWVDILEPFPGKRYKPETSRHMLTMVPNWAYTMNFTDEDFLRHDIQLYHYLLEEGVAGCWSYVFHPKVIGDKEYYYFQRTNHDRTKACVILKHCAEGEVVICPRGLLPEHQYIVGFDSNTDTTIRSGSDLMANGIVIKDQKPGELVYLGLPNRPGAPADKTAIKEPGRVFKRFETNLGHSGVGIYWSPGTGENWISYYEVRREDKILGKASIGNFYFDHLADWDCLATYSVRAVGSNGMVSEWKDADTIEGEALTFSVLGGHFRELGRDGWSAETTVDGKVFEPMIWVAPVKNPAADIDGGTPNQIGGVEGYWEGAGASRVGRGWQQASTNAACVRSWTAPRQGTIHVVGRAMKEYYRQGMGNPLRVYIEHGNRQVWPMAGLAEIRLNDLVGVTHDIELTVQAGDIVRFVLEKGSEPENNIISWMPKITYAGAPGVQKETPALRILCGSSADYTDKGGNVWSKDMFYKGGEATSTHEKIAATLPTSEDMPLYQIGREGEDFTYSIPVKPGLYAIRLKFAETKTQWIFERPINLSINGQRLLTNFDVYHVARGSHRAYEKTFHNIMPDANGFLTLRFTGGFDPLQTTHKALIHAIEVSSEIKPEIRIDCGSESQFVDWNSDIWAADTSFKGGQMVNSDTAVTQASPTVYDQKLYQTARSGKSIVYKVAVSPGLYTVHLKFAELWLRNGKRQMNIEVNGLRVRENWDPREAAGSFGMAADIRVENIVPDHDGHINFSVTASGPNDAIIQGIEIE